MESHRPHDSEVTLGRLQEELQQMASLVTDLFQALPTPTPTPYLAIRGGVDAVVVHAALVAQRDGPLPGAALTLAHQEAAIDAATEQVLGSIAGHGPVVP